MSAINQRQFYDRIGEITEEFDRRSLNYRAIGSTAAAALDMVPIDFSPRDAVEPIDRRPDLDVLVPRDQLAGARAVREMFGPASKYPVKVGLAVPSMQVDIRQDSDESFLTLGRKRVAIRTELFDAQTGKLDDTPIRTVNPETLRHIYTSVSPQRGELGAYYRRKSEPINAVLGPDPVHEAGDPYLAFHEYAKLQQVYTPLSRRSMEMFISLARHMTPEQRERYKRMALRMSAIAGWR